MITRNERRYYAIPTGNKKVLKCSSCERGRQTTNKEKPFICEICLRTIGRDLVKWRLSNTAGILVVGLVVGFIIGATIF